MTHVVDKFSNELGCTVRDCLDCGCLVPGGPTRCKRCADEPETKGQQMSWHDEKEPAVYGPGEKQREEWAARAGKPEAKEPGQVAYENWLSGAPGLRWELLGPSNRRKWESVGRAVLEAADVEQLQNQVDGLEMARAAHERRTGEATQELLEARKHLDAVAATLHPHWKGDGHTYIPERLPGMVERLQRRITELEVTVAFGPLKPGEKLGVTDSLGEILSVLNSIDRRLAGRD